MFAKKIDDLMIQISHDLWGLSVVGVGFSIVLALCNVTMGISAVIICLEMLCLFLGIAIGLLPKQLVDNDYIESHRSKFLILMVCVSMFLTGLSCLISGGLPTMELLLI